MTPSSPPKWSRPQIVPGQHLDRLSRWKSTFESMVNKRLIAFCSQILLPRKR